MLAIGLLAKTASAHSGDTVYANYGTNPVIDGTINLAEWSNAGTLRFVNSTDTVTAYFMHDGSSLFIALDIPDNTNNSFDDCGFHIDPAHNGGSSSQSDDFLFRINRGGNDKREGTGPGMFPGAVPSGWEVSVSDNVGGWQAEYRFDFTKFNIPAGTDFTMGLFIHTWDDAIGSDTDNWPSGDIYFEPDIWADLIISSVTTNSSEYSRQISEINVYPNPSYNNITLQFFNPKNEIHTLIIYNCNGQPIDKFEKITSGSVQIENKEWPNGLYYLQLQNDRGEIVGMKKIIKTE